MSVGITTGRVFCGEAGCNQRREYTLSGDKVNLAARLMQAAGRSDVADQPSKVGSDEVILSRNV